MLQCSPNTDTPWDESCSHKPEVDCRGQRFIVASFSQVGKAVCLATDVEVTLKEDFLLSFQAQSMAHKAQELEVTMASLFDKAANG